MNAMQRREFSRTLLTAASAAQILRANERLRIGVIGCGGRGREVLRDFLKTNEVEAVALCDVYKPFLAEAREMSGGKADTYEDYRRLLERKDIDAVIIATPDHWHALMTIDAVNSGKDVYCEKPLTLMIGEGRRMVEAARRTNKIVQTGSQQRSGSHYASAVKLIRDGALGDVHVIKAGFARNEAQGFAPRALAGGLTSDLNWDLWLGPAPYRPFDPFRCIYNFRWFWDYSGGQMTNWGAHHLDIARWIVNEPGPLSVSGFAARFKIKDGGETPDVQEVIYRFRNSVVTWSAREINDGRGPSLDIHGSLGTMTLVRRGYTVHPETRNKKALMEALSETGTDLNSQHIRNFLDCVKSRKLPNADVEEGHRSAVMCHLGNIASRLNRTVQWDPASEKIIGDAEAAKLAMRPYRAPWKLS
jgi:predicted dehydrogenase